LEERIGSLRKREDASRRAWEVLPRRLRFPESELDVVCRQRGEKRKKPKKGEDWQQSESGTSESLKKR
jgi:hypothetical protein